MKLRLCMWIFPAVNPVPTMTFGQPERQAEASSCGVRQSEWHRGAMPGRQPLPNADYYGPKPFSLGHQRRAA
jgi:hypothetical protein